MAQTITVLEMSATNIVVDSHRYTPAEFPTEIQVSANTAYVIVETVSIDPEGNETINRQICSANHTDEHFDVFIPAQNGYAIKQTTKVITA